MKSNAAARGKARRFVLQALYQAQMTGEEFALVMDPFIAEHNMKRADIEYFRDLLRGIHNSQQELQELLGPTLDRTWDELDPIEKSVLLIGAYELKSRIDVPYKVVINEGVELAKSFGASESYKLINSVLDALSSELRQLER